MHFIVRTHKADVSPLFYRLTNDKISHSLLKLSFKSNKSVEKHLEHSYCKAYSTMFYFWGRPGEAQNRPLGEGGVKKKFNLESEDTDRPFYSVPLWWWVVFKKKKNYIVSETPMLKEITISRFLSKTKICHSSPKVVYSRLRSWLLVPWDLLALFLSFIEISNLGVNNSWLSFNPLSLGTNLRQ